jgi:ribonuclease HI
MMDIDNRRILLVQSHNRCWHPAGGSWRLILRTLDGQTLLDATDIEPGVTGERLDLLTVVRGLEALEQESAVTLITDQRYVIRGMRYGLEEWREQGWKWMRFGDLVEINHADLWQRLDNALNYHQLQCRYFRCDAAHGGANRHVPRPHFARRRRGRIVTAETSAVETEAEIAPPSVRGLDPQWMDAATEIGQQLAHRWQLVLQ